MSSLIQAAVAEPFIGSKDSGLQVYAPPVVQLPPFMSRMGLLELTVEKQTPDFIIIGDLCQIVQITLPPGQGLQGEPGSMCYQSNGITLKVKIGGLGRALFDGNIFKDQFTNETQQPGYIGLTAPFPATIVPMDLRRFGGQILLKRDAFLAALDPNTSIGISIMRGACTCATCCCAGVPLVMQRVQTQGWVFAAAHGTIVHKLLAPGEEILIHSHSLVACTTDVSLDVRAQSGCCNFCCSGQDAFQTALKGPGEVWLSSMPIEKLRQIFATNGERKKKGAAEGVAAALR